MVGVGRGGEDGVLGVGEVELGGGDVGFELLDGAGAWDDDGVGPAEDPCQGHLGGCGFVDVGDRGEGRRSWAARSRFSGRNIGLAIRIGDEGRFDGLYLPLSRPWASGL